MTITSLADLYFTAAIAVEKDLPPASRALIERHDEISRAWGKAGWPMPIPAELKAAQDAMHADPLAHAAIGLRVKGNEALAQSPRTFASAVAALAA